MQITFRVHCGKHLRAIEEIVECRGPDPSFILSLHYSTHLGGLQIIATLLKACVIFFSCSTREIEGHVENIARMRKVDYSGLASSWSMYTLDGNLGTGIGVICTLVLSAL